MNGEICVGIAGVVIQEHRPAHLGLAVPPAYRPFLVAHPGPELVTVAVEPPAPSAACSEPLFQAEDNWSLYRAAGGGYLFRTRFVDAVTDEGLASWRIQPHPAVPEAMHTVFHYPLDELLVIGRLASCGGVVLHGCGVEVGEGVVLFCGLSGAGKSTLARLWSQRGYRILSDDRVAVVVDEGGVTAHGTPWHGDGGFAAPISGPLVALFFIEHGEANHCTPLGGGGTGALLVRDGFLPVWQRTLMDHALDTVASLARMVPAWQLAFVPGDTAVDHVLHHLGESR